MVQQYLIWMRDFFPECYVKVIPLLACDFMHQVEFLHLFLIVINIFLMFLYNSTVSYIFYKAKSKKTVIVIFF